MSQPQSKKKKPIRHLFGTDGVRGVANQEPMTSEMALKLGRAIAKVLHETKPSDSVRPASRRRHLRARTAKTTNTATRF